ncbi:hypothetical protein [Naasia sp. SYSU D00057]|uniref:hypothetical protein n=1 Tax=Naasia sp. SYSU D00057 TaxID=2817380 RepID=UPI001B300D27|nr:hypothetical protein [Naasia sp. SYSU D00057]
MPRSVYTVVLAVFALVAVSVIATLVTLSGSTDAALMKSAVWAWASAGGLAFVAMVAFGFVVLRRAGRAARAEESTASVKVPAEVSEPVFA